MASSTYQPSDTGSDRETIDTPSTSAASTPVSSPKAKHKKTPKLGPLNGYSKPQTTFEEALTLINDVVATQQTAGYNSDGEWNDNNRSHRPSTIEIRIKENNTPALDFPPYIDQEDKLLREDTGLCKKCQLELGAVMVPTGNEMRNRVRKDKQWAARKRIDSGIVTEGWLLRMIEYDDVR